MNELVDLHFPPEAMEEQWDVPGLEKDLAEYGVIAPVAEWLAQEPALKVEALKERIQALAKASYLGKVELAGDETFRQFERAVFLQHLDHNWREHLSRR
jgi:preprotein translocase subunit SecA